MVAGPERFQRGESESPAGSESGTCREFLAAGDTAGGKSGPRGWMGPRLDTCVLLFERRAARILFLVHRACDGWLALDLAGPVTDRFVPGIEVVRGGESFPDRVLALHALDRDPALFGGLRVPGPRGAHFGLGGDVERLLDAARSSGRLRFFRGLSAIPGRSRAVPPGAIVVPATPDLVFAASARELRELACAPRTSRSDSPWDRAAARDSARARTG